MFAVLPGHTQQRIGIPVLVTASPTTAWGRSGRWSSRVAPPPQSSALTCLIILVLHLKVGGSRIEVEDVHLQIQQVGYGGVHLPLHLILVLQQKVHGPVQLLYRHLT